MIPSNKVAKETVSGTFSIRSSAPHSRITQWRKVWKQEQLARACNESQLHISLKKHEKKNEKLMFDILVQLSTKTPLKQNNGYFFNEQTCKTTLRKQLFPRFCNPGTKKDFSDWFGPPNDHGKLVGIPILPSLSANIAETIPKRAATEGKGQFIGDIVRNPSLKPRVNTARFA